MSFNALVGLVLVVILVGGYLLWRRRIASQRLLSATMDALNAQADVLVLDSSAGAKRRARVADRFRTAVAEAPDSLGRASQALWMALLSEVVADETIDNREIFDVADLFGQITGKKLEPQFVLNAAREAAQHPGYAIDEIAKASVSLNQEEKHLVLQAACLIVVSDQRVDASEASRLLTITQALGLPKEAGLAVIQDMSQGS